MRIALVSVGASTPSQLERLLAVAARLDGPVTFAPAAAELVPCLRAHPALAGALSAAFAAGQLAPLSALAHGGSGALLDARELADELRLGDELLQSLGATPPERRGAICDGDVAALEAAGIDFVLSAAVTSATRVGERLIALPYDDKDAIVVRVDGDDGEALEAAAARVESLIAKGATLVALSSIAAPLTPPWLARTELASETPTPALAAMHEVCRWMLESFDFASAPQIPVLALADEGWRLDRLPPRARLPLLLRRVTSDSRRTLVAAFELCDQLAVEARIPGRPPRVQRALDVTVLERLHGWSEAHGASEPMATALAAYHELQEFRFLGASRWRALAAALRDGFALLSMRRDHDWQLEPTVEETVEEEPISLLHLVEQPGMYN